LIFTADSSMGISASSSSSSLSPFWQKITLHYRWSTYQGTNTFKSDLQFMLLNSGVSDPLPNGGRFHFQSIIMDMPELT
jgi:hypothetical protein